MLYASGRNLIGIEVKSAATFASHFKKTLLRFSEKQQTLQSGYVVYNGAARKFSDGIEAIHFSDANSVFRS